MNTIGIKHNIIPFKLKKVISFGREVLYILYALHAWGLYNYIYTLQDVNLPQDTVSTSILDYLKEKFKIMFP